MPGPIRSAAATLRGYYLRQWRYGPETDRLVQEAIARERWTEKQWGQWREAQIIQESLDVLRVRYVPAPDITDHTERDIAELLRARLGKMQIIFERRQEIPRTANGKFRAVICRLPKESAHHP